MNIFMNHLKSFFFSTIYKDQFETRIKTKDYSKPGRVKSMEVERIKI